MASVLFFRQPGKREYLQEPAADTSQDEGYLNDPEIKKPTYEI